MNGLDLFSGARGWEARAHGSLGVDLLGIEWWEPAVKTSEAAGLRTLHADVAALDPLDFADEVGEDGILVGSPPCQSRSAAGKGLGKLDVPRVTQCMLDLADGRDTRAEHKAACADERSILTVEPLRWALALRPRAVILEQVPPVLPDWKLVGSLLERFGYSWWAGVLEAERYGVPQTRERAVLIARRDGVPAHPPAPTHHRFVPNEPRPVADMGLFGGGLLPWVSMAEALGWEAPLEQRFARGAGMTERHGERPGRDTENDPSFTILAGNQGSGTRLSWHQRKMVANSRPNAATRQQQPAPTIKGGHDTADRVWVHDRPATNVNGDARISKPGWHDPKVSGSQQAGAVRVSPEEAACLQSFPAGWPFQGSKTAIYTQIGNAVPALMAEAILATVAGVAPPTPR